MVSRDIEQSLAIVNQVIFLAHGEVVFSGSPERCASSIRPGCTSLCTAALRAGGFPLSGRHHFAARLAGLDVSTASLSNRGRLKSKPLIIEHMNFIRTIGATPILSARSAASAFFRADSGAVGHGAHARPPHPAASVFAGVLSMLIVAVSGLFVDMVLGLQGYTQLAKFQSADVLGYTVAASLLRELGPVLAAILLQAAPAVR